MTMIVKWKKEYFFLLLLQFFNSSLFFRKEEKKFSARIVMNFKFDLNFFSFQLSISIFSFSIFFFTLFISFRKLYWSIILFQTFPLKFNYHFKFSRLLDSAKNASRSTYLHFTCGWKIKRKRSLNNNNKKKLFNQV